MALNTLTIEERRAALDLALQVRRHRSAAKDALRTRDTTLADFLGTEDPVLAGTRVIDVFRALPKPVLVGLAMRALKVNPRKTVGGLGPTQRAALLRAAKNEEER